MRPVPFVVIGGVGGKFEEDGTIADLLLAVPYLLMSRIVPPLHVTNDLLARGGSDAGMSGACRWEPFQISRDEWVELVEHLESLPDDQSCEFVQSPDWVATIDDWHAWIMIFKHGYPEEFRDVDREVRQLEEARRKAVGGGNDDLVLELHLRLIRAGERLAEIAMEVNRKRKS